MRIAFCGHSHHQITRSSQFLLQALRSLGQVEEFWVDSWRGGGPFDATPVVEGGYDSVVVFQMESVARSLAESRLPSVTFFPMYDSCYDYPDSFWRALEGIKVVCLCSALHSRLQRLGLRSRYVQFFPEVGDPAETSANAELAGYFWQRTQDLTWTTVRALLGDAVFEQFTIHDALDPLGGHLVPPTPEEVSRYHLRTTRWFPSREALRADLLRHNVYFAPRLREGIGMSFLEAMAMGFLVVAPELPTMSEYLVSGVNGLLYDPQRPAPLDFSRHREMGRRARRSVEVGREQWVRSLPSLLELVAAPTRDVLVQASVDALDPLSLGPRGRPRAPAVVTSPGHPGAADPGRTPATQESVEPIITIAVLGGDRDAGLPDTIGSILAQDGLRPEIMLSEREVRQGTMAALPEDRLAGVHLVSGESRGARMNAVIQAATGRYLLFLRAGDRLQRSDVLSTVLRDIPCEQEAVVISHHVLRDHHGAEELRPAADFAAAYTRLLHGDLSRAWLAGMPSAAAVLWPTALLREHRFREDLPATAHLELLCRLARQGIRFHHSLTALGTSPRAREDVRARLRLLDEWQVIAREYAGSSDLPGPALDRLRFEARSRDLHELPASHLMVALGRVPGVVRELKRRFRARRARSRARARPPRNWMR